MDPVLSPLYWAYEMVPLTLWLVFLPHFKSPNIDTDTLRNWFPWCFQISLTWQSRLTVKLDYEIPSMTFSELLEIDLLKAGCMGSYTETCIKDLALKISKFTWMAISSAPCMHCFPQAQEMELSLCSSFLLREAIPNSTGYTIPFQIAFL